ncbi:MAG: ABC transporter substrate-binding protein [Actinobacteria bacterium]|nr:ABC transporter substrate-binding protein [Actinomycetota bacterium]
MVPNLGAKGRVAIILPVSVSFLFWVAPSNSRVNRASLICDFEGGSIQGKVSKSLSPKASNFKTVSERSTLNISGISKSCFVSCSFSVQKRMQAPGPSLPALPFLCSALLFNGEANYPESLYASGRNFVRSVGQITGATCSTVPVGTGAFKYVSHKLTELVVAKNENYWRKDAKGGALPYLDGITFTFLPDAAPRVSGVKSGSLAATMFSSASEAKQILALQKNKNVTTISSPLDYYPTIWLNHKIAPFSSKNARLAFSHSLDRAKWLKVRQKGLGTVPDSIVGPNNIMYNKKGYAGYDLKKAKEYVAAYTAETGKALEFSLPYVSASADSTANAQLLKEMAEAAGMKVNLLSVTTAEAIQKAFPMQFQLLPLLLMEGTGTAFSLPFLVSDTSGGNPTHFLRGAAKLSPALAGLQIFYSILNISSFKDEVSENLLFAARAEPNAAKAKKLYMQATEQLQKEAHVANISFLQYTLSYNKLGGVGELGLAAGGPRRLITNFGIDWTGVWSTK